ncbi:MAG: PilZ domain-containing protein [Planctomycetota bacterium]
MLDQYQSRSPDRGFKADLLRKELAGLKDDSIALRRHARHKLQHDLQIYGGELSEDSKIEGVCRDISQSGLGAVTHDAPAVGENYWLIADDFEPMQSPVHAMCVRCRLLPSRAFDAGFVFLSPITLPDDLV